MASPNPGRCHLDGPGRKGAPSKSSEGKLGTLVEVKDVEKQAT